MPVTVIWDNPEKTITRLCFAGRFTVNDVFDAWQKEYQLMISVYHPVYSLNIFEPSLVLPTGFSISKARVFIEFHQPKNLQMTIQVAEIRSIRVALKAIANTMPHTVHVVESLDKAHEIIKSHQVQHPLPY